MEAVVDTDAQTDGSDRTAIDRVIMRRRSVRRFTSRPVPRHVLLDILELAGRAPSNSNMQPWQVYLATGAIKDGLAQAISDAHRAAPDDY
jgi:nitroreductase